MPRLLHTLTDREFIKLVKRYLKKNNISQAQLADEMCVSTSTMSQILNHRIPPTEKLCQRFECQREKVIIIGEIDNK